MDTTTPSIDLTETSGETFGELLDHAPDVLADVRVIELADGEPETAISVEPDAETPLDGDAPTTPVPAASVPTWVIPVEAITELLLIEERHAGSSDPIAPLAAPRERPRGPRIVGALTVSALIISGLTMWSRHGDGPNPSRTPIISVAPASSGAVTFGADDPVVMAPNAQP